MKNYSFLILILFPFIMVAQSPKMTLQEAIQIALQNNYDVTIAKNENEIGKINNSWGNADALPVISATTNKSIATNNLQQNLSNGTVTKKSNASTDNINAGLAVSWRFFDGMKMYATKKRLEELEKMGTINFTKMMNTTAYEVIADYYSIISLRQQLSAIKEVIDLYQERLKIADTRFKIGSSAKPDYLQAQVDLNEQLANYSSIENAINISKTNLNTILSRDPATAFETEDSFRLNKSIEFTALQQKIEKQNPDIQLAQSNLAVLMQTKKEINAQRLPTASLNGNYNFSRTKNGAGFTLLNQTYGPSVAVGVAIPIYNGGNVKRQLQVADINIKNQDITIKQIKNQLQSTLANAYFNYTNGVKLAELEENNLLLVRENNMINFERYKRMAITSIELRQGQINYTDAQTRLISALYQAKLAEAEMLLLTGEITN